MKVDVSKLEWVNEITVGSCEGCEFIDSTPEFCNDLDIVCGNGLIAVVSEDN